jgi:hypothetical protein
MVKAASSTGALSIATGGTDYEFPLTFTAPLSPSTNTISVSANGITDSLWRQGAAISVIGRSAGSVTRADRERYALEVNARGAVMGER